MGALLQRHLLTPVCPFLGTLTSPPFRRPGGSPCEAPSSRPQRLPEGPSYLHHAGVGSHVRFARGHSIEPTVRGHVVKGQGKARVRAGQRDSRPAHSSRPHVQATNTQNCFKKDTQDAINTARPEPPDHKEGSDSWERDGRTGWGWGAGAHGVGSRRSPERASRRPHSGQPGAPQWDEHRAGGLCRESLVQKQIHPPCKSPAPTRRSASPGEGAP